MKRRFSQAFVMKPDRTRSLLGAIGTSRIKLAGLLAVTFLAANLPAIAQGIGRVWDGSLVVNGVAVPFRIEISTKGTDASSYFFNGYEKVNPSTRGSFRDGNLLLEFASYATELTATLKDGALTGAYVISAGNSYPFHAEPQPAAPQAAAGSEAPNIGGSWEIQVKSPKGESAWRLLVNQSGASVSASILRVDGDTGTLSGTYRDGKLSSVTSPESVPSTWK